MKLVSVLKASERLASISVMCIYAMHHFHFKGPSLPGLLAELSGQMDRIRSKGHLIVKVFRNGPEKEDSRIICLPMKCRGRTSDNRHAGVDPIRIGLRCCQTIQQSPKQLRL